MNPDAFSVMSDDVAAQMPNTPEHTAVACVQDPAILGSQLDEYGTRLTKWLSS
jgi:hypothetical protein